MSLIGCHLRAKSRYLATTTYQYGIVGSYLRRFLSGRERIIDSFLFLSLPLKVAKSPNLRRLSRDLLLEILDAIADYLKESNIAVNS